MDATPALPAPGERIVSTSAWNRGREFVCMRCQVGQCARCTDRACTCCYGNED